MKPTEMEFMHTKIESSPETTHRGTSGVPSKQTESPGHVTPESARQQPKVAYIMSRFPKITETFVLYEMLALEKQGIQVEVYPLQREQTEVMHPEAIPFVERAHFGPLLSWPVARAQFYFLSRKPLLYFGILLTLIRANWSSSRFLLGALAFFPKAVHFARLMQVEAITHIHAHFASHPAAAAYVIRRLTGIPYSFTAHGSDLHRDQHMLREKVDMAAFVVPISHYNKRIIVATCNGQHNDKTIVIHCGVDTHVFKPRANPTPYEQGTGPFTILCIGTLHEVKGQTYLIEACRLLQERGIDFVCRLVADGPDMAMLQLQAAEAGLSDRVYFHGRLTRNEVANLLSNADVMVTPSVPTSNGRREGIPVVLMEGMASEVPVVASDLSGIPELVENEVCGLLVPPRDVQGLAAAIERLYNDSDLRHRFGKAGRVKVLDEFDVTLNAATLASYFRLCALEPE
jgi:colanic acid/amylovoran biosynthesis glycosyltransferase